MSAVSAALTQWNVELVVLVEQGAQVEGQEEHLWDSVRFLKRVVGGGSAVLTLLVIEPGRVVEKGPDQRQEEEKN